MQGKKEEQQKLFYMIGLNRLVPPDHPVRRIKENLGLAVLVSRDSRVLLNGREAFDRSGCLVQTLSTGLSVRDSVRTSIVPRSAGEPCLPLVVGL